jgi:glutathionyl-hydroquinone reductase
MGRLIDGVWHPEALVPNAREFKRQPSLFRGALPAVEAGRYHLYAAWACPWAHRTLITRSLRGLTGAVGATIVAPRMGEDGWAFRPDDPDPIGGARFLHEVYTRADPGYHGRATVPVLWDRATGKIVNNESREVMRIFDVDMAPLSVDPLEPTLAPPELRAEIDRVLDEIYEPINNGVYRAGFARTQEKYEEAAREVFAALAHWDAWLARRPYLVGERLTEADIALFTTMLRFDLVYHGHFKLNLRRLRDHAHLWRLTRRLYQHPGIRPTCKLDEIKTHYYWSQPDVNPHRIVPIGPELEAELAAPV